jgi:hypothetical protein
MSTVNIADDLTRRLLALAQRFADDRHERLGGLTFSDARQMADLLLWLDGWLCAGAPLPERWNVPRGPVAGGDSGTL